MKHFLLFISLALPLIFTGCADILEEDNYGVVTFKEISSQNSYYSETQTTVSLSATIEVHGNMPNDISEYGFVLFEYYTYTNPSGKVFWDYKEVEMYKTPLKGKEIFLKINLDKGNRYKIHPYYIRNGIACKFEEKSVNISL